MVAAPVGDLTSDCAEGGTFNEMQAVAKRQRMAAPAGDLLLDCADDGDVEAEAAVLVHESLAASSGGGEIKDRGENRARYLKASLAMKVEAMMKICLDRNYLVMQRLTVRPWGLRTRR